MKYTKCFSILYGLRTLNVTSSSDLDSDRCMRKNFRLTDALSPVSEITLKPAHSRFLTTSQAIGCRSSADRSVVGYWAYGNWRLIKIPRTINTSMCFATVRSAAPFMDFSKASSALFTSPKSTKPTILHSCLSYTMPSLIFTSSNTTATYFFHSSNESILVSSQLLSHLWLYPNIGLHPSSVILECSSTRKCQNTSKCFVC